MAQHLRPHALLRAQTRNRHQTRCQAADGGAGHRRRALRGIGEKGAVLAINDKDGEVRVSFAELVFEFVGEGVVDVVPEGAAAMVD